MTTTALKATLLPYDPQLSSHTPIFTHTKIMQAPSSIPLGTNV